MWRIQDVEHIKDQVRDHCGVVLTGRKGTLPARPSYLQSHDWPGREAAVVEELQKLVAGINELDFTFQSMERPEALTDIPTAAMLQVAQWCPSLHSSSAWSFTSGFIWL